MTKVWLDYKYTELVSILFANVVLFFKSHNKNKNVSASSLNNITQECWFESLLNVSYRLLI